MIGDNKVNHLKVDEDGYYRVVLGQLGTPERGGFTYQPDTVRKAFIDRLNRGAPMYVEYGQPRVAMLTQLEAHSRRTIVDERRVCGVLIRGGADIRGRDEHLIAHFKPLGPMASLVQDILATEDDTLSFRMRGFANPADRTDLKAIVTWDLVLSDLSDISPRVPV
jgi:hypothetical protein